MGSCLMKATWCNMNLLSWIMKKIAGYERNKNKKGLKTAITFFHVLIPLLNALPSADALKTYVSWSTNQFCPVSPSRKVHMDQALELAKIEILPNLKPQKAYEKRLSTIMAKENLGFLDLGLVV